MSLVLVGIDEAGYGPLLGPLCVGACALEVRGWVPGDPAPDLWTLLERAVCESPRDPHKRIAVADSKALKGPNTLKTRHPLGHLERGVFAFLCARDASLALHDDCALFTELGVACGTEPWHDGRVPLPLSGTESKHAVDAGMLRRAMEQAGVTPLVLRCRIVREAQFNSIVRQTGSKASTTLSAVSAHIRQAACTWRGRSVRVVCDRLGGRTRYLAVLRDALGKIAGRVGSPEVEPLEESDAMSVYRVSFGATGELDATDADFRVHFMPEAERAHLPVAMASMAAKLVRELCMARFNAYWQDRLGADLRPTAGYTTDARRWLAEAGDRIDADTRARLIRLA